MFKILVDGIEHSRYAQTFRGCITVGSAADAQVRLPWAAPLSLQIRPLTDGDGGDFAVTVHDPEGMTHNTAEWWGKRITVQHYPDPLWVRVRGGDSNESMIIRGHVIQVITWCATCGRQPKQLWQCTCADRRT